MCKKHPIIERFADDSLPSIPSSLIKKSCILLENLLVLCGMTYVPGSLSYSIYAQAFQLECITKLQGFCILCPKISMSRRVSPFTGPLNQIVVTVYQLV